MTRRRYHVILVLLLFTAASLSAQQLSVAPGFGATTFIAPLGDPEPPDFAARRDALPPCATPDKGGCRENVSLGAFRVETHLAFGILKHLHDNNQELLVVIESMSADGTPTPQTPSWLPPAHLRPTQPDGSPDSRAVRVAMKYDFPEELYEQLKNHATGGAQLLSPWIVAVSDPRASIHYQWPAGVTPASVGCVRCECPPHLRGKTVVDGVYEIYTAGHALSVRLVITPPGGPYMYLTEQGRLRTSADTVRADTRRIYNVLVSPQNPPVAGGVIDQTVYVHSGEFETSTVDLAPGGRAGWNVTVGRTYRSRSIGDSPFGPGWSSALFRHLRPLPTGDVEYRDGEGEIWLFRRERDGRYTAPSGLFLRLAGSADAIDRWVLIDQRGRVSAFDRFGRLTHAADAFAHPSKPGTGNRIAFTYDGDRLATVIDPVGRSTKLEYWSEGDTGAGAFRGHVRRVTDWRGRTVDYEYDTLGRLVAVKLPTVPNSTGAQRPTIRCSYESVTGYKDVLELADNLKTLTEPAGPKERLTLTYGTGADRDRLKQQTWGTGETVTFAWPEPGSAETKDALGQVRRYTLSPAPTSFLAERSQVVTLTEPDIEVAKTAFGALPEVVFTSVPERLATTRSFTFGYGLQGTIRSIKLDGLKETIFTWKEAQLPTPGLLLQSTETKSLLAVASAKGLSATANDPITTTIDYQPATNPGAFIAGVTRNGKRIEYVEPNRDQKEPTSTNSSVSEHEVYDDSGLLKSVAWTGGTMPDTEGAETAITWADADRPMHERGLPKEIDEGGLRTTISYPTASQTITTDAARGVATTEYRDDWDRPAWVTTTGPGLDFDERFSYDATGRPTAHDRKQGVDPVRTSWDYDVMGRVKSVTTDKVAVRGRPSQVTTTITWDLPNRRVVTTHPGGATTTTTLDRAGRVASSVLYTGPTTGEIESHYAWDIDDNLVFETDRLMASAYAFDVHRRQIASVRSDGARTGSTHDAWGRLTSLTEQDASGTVTGTTTIELTDAGRLASLSSATQTMRFAWGAGETRGVESENRAFVAEYDKAGRLLRSKFGEGTILALPTPFKGIEATAHRGRLATELQVSERNTGSAARSSAEAASPYSVHLDHDTAGNVTYQRIGNLESHARFDQEGNALSITNPRLPPTVLDYDSQGAVTRRTFGDGATVNYEWHENGALAKYTDPTGEATTNETDLIGRPLKRTYPDGTVEGWTWSSTRLTSYTDRQGRTRLFDYNDKGQLTGLRAQGGAQLEKYDYDTAGRLVSLTTRDASVTFEDFDPDGRPRRTRAIRYADGGAFAGGAIVDELTQEHTWNNRGERTLWTLPHFLGMDAPGWTESVQERFDAAGNVEALDRQTFGEGLTNLLVGAYRGGGRPVMRAISTRCGWSPCTPATIERGYGYDATNGLLTRLEVSTRGHVVAGSEITWDGLQRGKARLLGLAGEQRSNEWTYDDRGRLKTVKIAKLDQAPPATEVLTPSDFRESVQRVASGPLDAPSVTFRELPGHKVGAIERGGTERVVTWNGGERVDDGEFVYEFDYRGRLASVTEHLGDPAPATLQRVRYTYDPLDRIIGRRLEYAPVPAGTAPAESDWRVEDRPAILAADGFPASTTFAWDPMTDRLVAIFRAGASKAATPPANGGLVRQILHGGLGYDDPIEVATIDPTTGAFGRLYPVFDEAGAGSLQVTLNADGEVVARSLTEGAYGEAESILTGAAVEGIAITASRDTQGTLTSVELSVRLTDDVDPATVVAGVRLAAVDRDGRVASIAAAAPELADSVTIRWRLTGAEWTTLTDTTVAAGVTPDVLSIAVTSSLRAIAWDDRLSILPVPGDVRSAMVMFTSPELPVENRQQFTTLTSWLDRVPAGASQTDNLYQVDALTLLAMRRFDGGGSTRADDPERLLTAAPFHAHPFQDPFTGKNYARARWYDPATGTFLSPDPMGYGDSSNLYAAFAMDPVNKSDSTGLAASMSQSGWIIATDNRNGGGIRRFSPKEIARDPMAVRAFLGRNADVDPRVADAMIERAGHSWVTGGDKMRIVAPGAAKAAGVYPLMAVTVGAGIGGGVGVAAASAGGFGFVGTAMLSGFTGGVGGQAGTDISDRRFSGTEQYLTTGSVSAVTSLVIGGVFVGGQRLFGTPDVFPSIMPKGGWAFPGAPTASPLRRTYKRVAFCRSVECEAIRTAEGLPIDPNTGEVIEGAYHFGHKYGYEHRRLLLEAQAKGMTQKQFNDWINSHPEWFQLEAPANNLSHRFEKPGVN